MRLEGNWRAIGICACAVIASWGSAHAEVRIDSGAGTLEGVETGVHFDIQGRRLYTDDAVLRTDVAFNDILSHCQPVVGGALCFDPVSGERGFHGDDGRYLNTAFYSAERDAYLEPNEAVWVPANTPTDPAEVEALAEAERQMYGGLRIYRGHPLDIAREMVVAKPTVSLWRIGKPQFDITTLERLDIPALSVHRTGPVPRLVLSIESLRTLLELHCGQRAASINDVGGVELRAHLRDFLNARLDRREAMVARINKRAARSGKRLPWTRETRGTSWMRFLDQLDEWFMFVQESDGRPSAIAVANFRWVGHTLTMDWVTASLRTAKPVMVEGQRGWSYGSEARGNYHNPNNLAKLVNSRLCAQTDR
ncbi:MAG: hypothetical protein ACI9U2_001178 [Bradymonadia bacterium]|jgi:hypothetical protein